MQKILLPSTAAQALEFEQIALLINHAEFKLQSLAECQLLANFIAGACPNPKLAVIGITEMFINAVEHGNLGVSYQEKTSLQANGLWLEEVQRRTNLPENQTKYVTIVFNKTSANITLHIKDAGDGFAWQQYQELDSTKIRHHHGRGIIMAKSLTFDKLEYSTKGNEVTCVINLQLT